MKDKDKILIESAYEDMLRVHRQRAEKRDQEREEENNQRERENAEQLELARRQERLDNARKTAAAQKEGTYVPPVPNNELYAMVFPEDTKMLLSVMNELAAKNKQVGHDHVHRLLRSIEYNKEFNRGEWDNVEPTERQINAMKKYATWFSGGNPYI